MATLRHEIRNGRGERAQSSHSSHHGWQMGRLRGEEFMVRYYLFRDVDRHRHLHIDVRNDTARPRMGGSVLHTRCPLVDLVRRLPRLLPREPGNAVLHIGGGEALHSDLVRASWT